MAVPNFYVPELSNEHEVADQLIPAAKVFAVHTGEPQLRAETAPRLVG